MADDAIVSSFTEANRQPIADTYPQTLLTRTPLTGLGNHYSTHLYTARLSINPLITVAAPLFSLISRLRKTTHYDNLERLQQELIHEIKAFESAAQMENYRVETIIIARYALCASLDEAITNTIWDENRWRPYQLLPHFQDEACGGERLFIILERLSEDSAYHIELLEMLYLCLSLGFEGKFRQMEQGKTQLDRTIDNLYQLIREQRGDFAKPLTKSTPQMPATQKNTAEPKAPPLPIWMTLLLTLIILLTLLTGFNYLLDESAAPLMQESQQLLIGHTRS